MDRNINKALNLLTLKIKDKAVERDYQTTISSESLVQYRFVMISGVLFYSIFSFVDSLTFPLVNHDLNMIRYYFVVPCLLFIFLSSFTPLYKKNTRFFNFLAILISGIGVIGMAYVGRSDPEISRIYVALIIVFFYLYALLNVSHLKAFPIGTILVGLYLLVAWRVNHLPMGILLYNIVMLTVSNLVGVTVATL